MVDQDYISKGCATYHNILYSSDICAASGLEVGKMYLNHASEMSADDDSNSNLNLTYWLNVPGAGSFWCWLL